MKVTVTDKNQNHGHPWHHFMDGSLIYPVGYPEYVYVVLENKQGLFCLSGPVAGRVSRVADIKNPKFDKCARFDGTVTLSN